MNHSIAVPVQPPLLRYNGYRKPVVEIAHVRCHCTRGAHAAAIPCALTATSENPQRRPVAAWRRHCGNSGKRSDCRIAGFNRPLPTETVSNICDHFADYTATATLACWRERPLTRIFRCDPERRLPTIGAYNNAITALLQPLQDDKPMTM